MANVGHNKLFGKVALITGGSRGIGQSLAAAYAREGARVFICARNQPSIDRAVMEIRNRGGEIDGLAGDVGRVEDVKRIVRGAADRYGIIDILVNNASLLGPRVPIADYPPSAWEEVVRVNLTGVFLMTQEVLRLMMPRRKGSIINISSGVGRVGKARWGAYAASKFAVEGFTQLLAEELKDLGIRVNAVNPGATRTEMRAAAYPGEDPLTLPVPEAIVPVFVYLASDASREVSGQSLEARAWSEPAD
jgi:NAD(P)-dependent dehydrogenase (short-subunit alcohol dehydrogenase family)